MNLRRRKRDTVKYLQNLHVIIDSSVFLSVCVQSHPPRITVDPGKAEIPRYMNMSLLRNGPMAAEMHKVPYYP